MGSGTFRLLLIAICFTAAAVTGYVALQVSSERPERLAGPLEMTIGAVRLRVDPAFLPSAGRSSADLELLTAFPDMRPAGAAVNNSKPIQADTLVVFRIGAQDLMVDPAERPAKLYARFLSQETWSHPGGLIMRRFEAGSPYDKEDLYLAPPEGRLFSARCMAPPPTPDGLPNTCVSDFRVGGLDVQMRFSPELLSSWELLVDRGRALVASMIRQ
jgi:hypothetical protein